MGKFYSKMKENQSTISIVIPFYNGDLFLSELLYSLNESYLHSSKLLVPEIIIINDSPDISEQTIRSIWEQTGLEHNLNIKLFVNSENKGVAYSRDLGTSHASGDFITWIDQDDFVHKTYFSVLEQRVQSKQNVYLLNGYICKNTADTAIPVFYVKPAVNFKHVLFNNPVLSTFFWIINRDFLNTLNVRFYLPEQIYKGVDDWFFSLQLTQNPLKIEYVSNRLIYYRFHETNFGNDVVGAIDGGLELLKTLQNNDTFPKHKLLSRIKTLTFSKRFYSENKFWVVFSEPFNFIRFLIRYCYDINRMLRFIRKLFHQTKFRT